MSEKQLEDVCVICHRPESKAGRMFHLPGNLCVCDDCMHKTMDMMAGMGYPGMPGMPFMSGTINPEELNAFMAGLQNGTGFGTQQPESGFAEQQEETAIPADENDDNTALNKTDMSKNNSEEGPDTEDAPNTEEPKTTPGQGRPVPPKGFPNISFINLADFPGFGGVPQRQRVKKKDDEEAKKPPLDIKDIPKPHVIKAKLDEYVIGQEHAKKVISVAVYNHYKRVFSDCNENDGVEIEKSNMLMIGPTGCGKTYLVRMLAKLLDVPLAIADATSLTEAGYIGDDIESVISKLLAAADNDVERAEYGIVFIDEIDKLAKKKNAHSRDVSGESVQQGLLKLLEGAEVEVPVGANAKTGMVPLETVNTKNILFICGGAFPELEEIIKQRLNKETGIGFSAELKDKYDKDKNLQSKVTVEDLRKFGMIPEFLGRLPVIYTLEHLNKEAMVKILREPRNAILKQYEKLLELDEVKLVFDDSALEAIAEKAMEKDIGARALRAILEDIMLDIMYEIPKDDNIGTVTITGDYVRGTGGPVIELRGVTPTEAISENHTDETTEV